jgi:hypothetical protein
VIPVSQYPEALLYQPSAPLSIVFNLITMLSAVDLDDQVALETHEINNVWADRLLASELEAVQPAVTQSLPQSLLGIGYGIS